MRIGAHYMGQGVCEFIVWAPLVKKTLLKIISPEEKTIPMERNGLGYWKVTVDGTFPGTQYQYVLEDKEGRIERSDPASFFQPEGVEGPSEVLDHREFSWEDRLWRGVRLPEMIIYEIHTGAFTPEGTFDAIIARLGELKEMGVNAVELMPVAQFPGERSWGYDGFYPFAVQNSYGGPQGLKRLVNECHRKGISVILDVLYNHGPAGNCLRDFGPYFTDRYKTPWGEAVNFDGPYSNEVRNFFIRNALYWFHSYHIDALRIPAVHEIFDMGAKHLLYELSERVSEFSRLEGRSYYLIAENDANDPRVVRPRAGGGLGLDALWCDDFHHALHILLTGEMDGCYADFGTASHLVKSLKEGYVYGGGYSVFRKKNHGDTSRDIPAEHFIVFSQNHAEVGGRVGGERLSEIVSFEALKLAASATIFSPYIPLLFMGEEYGETCPFLYFASGGEGALEAALRQGRSFSFTSEPSEPLDRDAFLRSKLNWENRYLGKGKVLLDFYRKIIAIRKGVPGLSNLSKGTLDVWSDEKKKLVYMRRWKDESSAFIIFNFNKEEVRVEQRLSGRWLKRLDSSDAAWAGPGAALVAEFTSTLSSVVKGESAALYIRAEG